MKTILFLIDTLETGGAEKSLLQILSRFKKYKPVVCSIYEGNTLQQQYELAGIKVIPLNLKGRFEYQKAVKELKTIIDKEHIELIHTTLYRSDIIGRKLKQKTGLPLINSFVNNSYSKERYEKLGLIGKCKLFYYQLRDRYTSRSVDFIISNSETIRKNNAKALGFPLSKIKVIYRGRNISTYSTTNSFSDANIELIESIKNKKVILNVSRLLPRKGQADLIKAFALLNPKLKIDTVLVIAGEGPYRTELEQLIHEHQLQGQVLLPGTIDDIPGLLNTATIFVFPTYYEGLPGALIEAMMAQKIIIASAIPENRECADETSVLFFEPGNIQALYDAMKRVLQAPEAFTSYAEQAREQSIEKFDINRIAEQYEATYDALLSTVLRDEH